MNKEDISRRDLEALHKLLYDKPLLDWGEGCTAQLADENDPEGLVVIKRADGTFAASMPRQVYEDIRETKFDERAT